MTGAAKPALPSSLTLVGAGKMGGALLKSWLDAGLDPGATTVLDPQVGDEIAALCANSGVALNPDKRPAAETLVLAIKPQGLEEAAPALAPLLGPDTLVVSILAGKTLANLEARLPGAGAYVRAISCVS